MKLKFKDEAEYNEYKASRSRIFRAMLIHPNATPGLDQARVCWRLASLEAMDRLAREECLAEIE